MLHAAHPRSKRGGVAASEQLSRLEGWECPLIAVMVPSQPLKG